MDEILTIPQVAKMLKMSKAKVYMLINQKKIPHVKIGRNVRILEPELIKWIEKHKQPVLFE